jgi:putative transcriptional regulator
MLKFTPENPPTPERGSVLLAEPFMDDPHFKRTVILLCEHNEEGSFGFVLNNYLDAGIDEIMNGMPPIESKVSVGGPVKHSNLYYVHTLGERLTGSMEVVDGIYMGGDFEELRQLLIAGEVKPDEVRFFVGYSGWSPNQLQEELDRKSWFVTKASSKVLMNTDDAALWRELVKNLGQEYSHLANLPKDPNLN